MPSDTDWLRLLERELAKEAHLAARDKRIVPLERQLARALRAKWLIEGEAASRYLRRHARSLGFREAGEFSLELTIEILEPGELATRNVAAGVLQNTAEAAYSAGADIGAADLGLRNPRAVAAFNYQGGQRIAGIDRATRRYIQTVLSNALVEGHSPQRAAREIVKRYAEFGAPSPLGHVRNRAELIAVTEMGDAYVAGNFAAAKASGLPVDKRWLTAGDERVDDEVCLPNEGAGWIDVDETFPSGHMGPTAHPGCRCDLQLRPRA